jgi:hypothetical protein
MSILKTKPNEEKAVFRDALKKKRNFHSVVIEKSVSLNQLNNNNK